MAAASRDELASIRADRTSGASELARRCLPILQVALGAGTVRDIAVELCKAQPSMAPIWNAAVQAVLSAGEPGRCERFSQQVRRAPASLARFAAEAIAPGGWTEPLRLVTISHSGTVRTVLDTLQARGRLRVACSEGRPGLEGRSLASRLAALGVPVDFYADAALAQALDGADAVLVGSDAVGPAAFLNKSGTCMLAAAAAARGVPVYVAAARHAFVMPALWPHLTARDEPPGEIWSDPPAGVSVRNRYFEPTPLTLVTSVITDAGSLGGDVVPQVCERLADERAGAALDELIALALSTRPRPS